MELNTTGILSPPRVFVVCTMFCMIHTTYRKVPVPATYQQRSKQGLVLKLYLQKLYLRVHCTCMQIVSLYGVDRALPE